MYPVGAHTLGLVCTAGLTLGTSVWVHRRSDEPEARWMTVLLVASSVWALASAGVVVAADPSVLRALGAVSITAAVLVSAAWFFFAVRFTDLLAWRPPLVYGVGGFYALLWLLLLTNETHQLFGAATLVQEPFAHFVVGGSTPVGFLFTVVDFAIIGTGLVLVGRLALTTRRLGRRQAAALFAGALVSASVTAAELAGLSPVGGLLFAPIGVGVFAVSTAWAGFSYDMFSVEPVARDTVLDAIEEGVVVVDDDHRVVDYDETAESLFPGLAGGRSLSTVAPDLVDGDGFATAVDRRVGDDRREFAVSATAYRGGHVLALRDVTERNAYTRRLEQQTERLESVAAAISHDLRNPLSIALGRVELVEDEHADAAADALHRMETIIDDTLALARSGQPIDDREPVSLDALARDAWETTDTGDASLGVDCDGVRLSADASRLRSCFENLFRNAVEHGSTSPDSKTRRDAVEHGSTSPASQAQQDAAEHGSTSPGSQTRQDAAGRASDESSVADAPEDAVEHGSTSPDSQTVQQTPDRTASDGGDDPPVSVTVGLIEDGEGEPTGFYVADDGPGIPADRREEVFDRGFSTADSGTGLGLSLVAAVADAHGWRVAATESETGGARFEFTGVEEYST